MSMEGLEVLVVGSVPVIPKSKNNRFNTLPFRYKALVVSPFYCDVYNKDLRGFKNLAGLATYPS
jgi:hypothetical protein